MKKKKINLLKKVFFTLLFGICSVLLLGSWTYDSNTDTITSDNLFHCDNIQSTTINDLTYYVTDNLIYFNGTTNSFTSIDISFYFDLNTSSTCYLSYNNLGSYNGSSSNTLISLRRNGSDLIQTNGFVRSSGYLYIGGSYSLHFSIGSGVSFNNYVIRSMLCTGSFKDFEPYGQTYINNSRFESLELEYEELYDNYQNLIDDYNTLQNGFDVLENEYQTLSTNYQILQQDYNTLESNYDDLSSRFSTLTDEYDTLLEEYQDLQQEFNDLTTQYNLIYQNYNLSNIYKYFSGCDVYCFNNNTQSLDYYINNTNTAVASGSFATISTDSSFASYSDLPSSIRSYISNIQPNVTINGYIMFKLNVPNSLGANIEYNYYGNGLKTALYNSITGDYLINELSEVGNISSLITDSFHSYDYLFIQFVSGDINFSRIYADENLQAYSNGYNTAMSNLNDYVQNYKNQIADLNIIIKNKQVQIDDLNNQLSNTLGWRPLFFAMADTPIKVVANVLGFELFGINLFQAFIGIITALAVIWLIRKIWK